MIAKYNEEQKQSSFSLVKNHKFLQLHSPIKFIVFVFQRKVFGKMKISVQTPAAAR